MNKAFKKFSISAVAGLALAAPMAIAVAPAHADEGDAVTLRLDATKGSKASGMATLTPMKDGSLKVEITGKNMVPNMPHAQHMHGDFSGANFTCPTDAADTDGNGFISIPEGVPSYGGVIVSLTTEGDASGDSGLALDRFPVADADGNLKYSRTLTAAELPEGTIEGIANLHIVQHGVDANGNDKYDLEGLGESAFAKSKGVDGIPEEGTTSATCGMVVPSGAVETGGEAPTAPNAGLLAAGGALAVGGAAVALKRRRTASVTGR